MKTNSTPPSVPVSTSAAPGPASAFTLGLESGHATRVPATPPNQAGLLRLDGVGVAEYVGLHGVSLPFIEWLELGFATLALGTPLRGIQSPFSESRHLARLHREPYCPAQIGATVTHSYFIDGREAWESDYTGAIDALPEDDLALTCIRAPGRGDVAISTDPGGVVVTETRADGSSWMSESMTRDHAKNIVGSFLNGDEDWRRGVAWEQTVLTSLEGRRRTFRILLIGAALVALVAWLVKVLTG